MKTKFEYFFFAPLDFESFRMIWKERLSEINNDDLAFIYQSWVSDFCRKSLMFYRNQFDLHRRLVWSDFCQHYSIPDFETPVNVGLEEHWNDWKRNNELDRHYERLQLAIQDTDILLKVSKKPNSVSASESIYDLKTKAEINREIYKNWFGKQVAITSRVAEELRRYPYEKYLQTVHWKKIRSLILLINRAVCQARSCNSMGESWYGGYEAEIDVHHVSYQNLGSEKFEDLVLLCRKHHGVVHRNLEETGMPGIDFDYS